MLLTEESSLTSPSAWLDSFIDELREICIVPLENLTALLTHQRQILPPGRIGR